jgi:toxin ParE1/3/4
VREKPKRVRWRARALADLRGFHKWLATLDRGNPGKTVGRIRAAADSMKRLGDIGRPSIEPGLRELSVRNAPYVIVYRIDGDTVEIVAVYHTAVER